MSNEDYREKIEEHRQSIELEEQQSSRMSRSRQVGKKKKKNRKNPLLNILLFVLLGIPFSLLIYVSFFYHPEVIETAEMAENGSLVEVQTNNTVSSSGKQKVEPKIEEIDSEPTEVNKVSTDSQDEEAKQAEIEAAKKAEQARLEEEKLAKQQEQQKQQEQVASSKTHTVQANENLFRIALKYYDDASGVDKIIEANNLSSNSISVGQTLIIP
ncbi:LysM peptidoglycan-binding domain-containing protein [Ureibacillus chungkukjangi]|uniref:LysM peptidoglycan-binding domain-containing protein n=1 Tax=Ureibacillus chungkukjangi TaxID=1202712 RepID=UPI00384EC3E3